MAKDHAKHPKKTKKNSLDENDLDEVTALLQRLQQSGTEVVVLPLDERSEHADSGNHSGTPALNEPENKSNGALVLNLGSDLIISVRNVDPNERSNQGNREASSTGTEPKESNRPSTSRMDVDETSRSSEDGLIPNYIECTVNIVIEKENRRSPTLSELHVSEYSAPSSNSTPAVPKPRNKYLEKPNYHFGRPIMTSTPNTSAKGKVDFGQWDSLDQSAKPFGMCHLDRATNYPKRQLATIIENVVTPKTSSLRFEESLKYTVEQIRDYLRAHENKSKSSEDEDEDANTPLNDLKSLKLEEIKEPNVTSISKRKYNRNNSEPKKDEDDETTSPQDLKRSKLPETEEQNITSISKRKYNRNNSEPKKDEDDETTSPQDLKRSKLPETDGQEIANTPKRKFNRRNSSRIENYVELLTSINEANILNQSPQPSISREPTAYIPLRVINNTDTVVNDPTPWQGTNEDEKNPSGSGSRRKSSESSLGTTPSVSTIYSDDEVSPPETTQNTPSTITLRLTKSNLKKLADEVSNLQVNSNNLRFQIPDAFDTLSANPSSSSRSTIDFNVDFNGCARELFDCICARINSRNRSRTNRGPRSWHEELRFRNNSCHLDEIEPDNISDPVNVTEREPLQSPNPAEADCENTVDEVLVNSSNLRCQIPDGFYSPPRNRASTSRFRIDLSVDFDRRAHEFFCALCMRINPRNNPVNTSTRSWHEEVRYRNNMRNVDEDVERNSVPVVVTREATNNIVAPFGNNSTSHQGVYIEDANELDTQINGTNNNEVVPVEEDLMLPVLEQEDPPQSEVQPPSSQVSDQHEEPSTSQGSARLEEPSISQVSARSEQSSTLQVSDQLEQPSIFQDSAQLEQTSILQGSARCESTNESSDGVTCSESNEANVRSSKNDAVPNVISSRSDETEKANR